MQLTPAERILDADKFVAAHPAILEANKGAKWVLPYQIRLDKYLKNIKK